MGIFFKRKEKQQIDKSKLPTHIAFIMDGNGRWAKSRHMPRNFGHKVGAESLEVVIRHARELGLKVVSFYAFSTENWNRPKEEVDEIFNIARRMLVEKKKSFVENNMRLVVSGFRENLPQDLVLEIQKTEEETKNNTGLIVNICLNYGSRAEIINAVNKIIKENVKEVSEDSFKNYLFTKNLPDPDLVVRTSGEQRLSNFMLYQCAYSEFYFPKTHWPDFREKDLDDAILNFQQRDRRFGKIKKEEK